MSSTYDKEKSKLIQDKCQVILGNLLREEDNKYCVDCDAKGPRWASWNLGIFLCIRCAGIHRNLGVHISKVKSVNLDSWKPEQVACLQQMGNSQARAVYEANLPENFRRPQSDSSLEAFIRAKYEQKKYIAKEWVPLPPPPPAFDIDEDKKKERERKKNKTKPLPQHPTAVPRPQSAGSHSPAIQPEPSRKTEELPDFYSYLPSDLLNLEADSNIGDLNIFDALINNPSSSVSDSSEPPYRSSVEGDFVVQRDVSVTNRANKMSKESILSLYGSGSVQIPATQHIAPVYGVPGGMYLTQQGFTPVGMPGYAPVPAQGISPCNTGTNMPAAYNPFASVSATTNRPDSRNQPNMWIGASGVRDESLLMPQGMAQVTQQMENIQLGQPWNLRMPTPLQNTAGNVTSTNQATPGVVWPPNTQNQNQNNSNNLWQ